MGGCQARLPSKLNCAPIVVRISRLLLNKGPHSLQKLLFDKCLTLNVKCKELDVGQNFEIIGVWMYDFEMSRRLDPRHSAIHWPLSCLTSYRPLSVWVWIIPESVFAIANHCDLVAPLRIEILLTRQLPLLVAHQAEHPVELWPVFVLFLKNATCMDQRKYF
jgi:hypothetical protein